MSSRFFYGNGSDSESSSSDEEELYSDREEEEEDEQSEEEDSSEEETSSEEEEEEEGEGRRGASIFLKDVSESEESEDEEKVTVVKSAKDKRLEELEGTIKLIENAERINDWTVISSGEFFDLFHYRKRIWGKESTILMLKIFYFRRVRQTEPTNC